MTGDFRILQVQQSDGYVQAVLPPHESLEQKTRESLFADFERLTSLQASSIQLDLQSVTFLDGSVPGRLVQFANTLSKSGCKLTVLVNSDIRELFRSLQLDRLFTIPGSSPRGDGLLKKAIGKDAKLPESAEE